MPSLGAGMVLEALTAVTPTKDSNSITKMATLILTDIFFPSFLSYLIFQKEISHFNHRIAHVFFTYTGLIPRITLRHLI
jgi:hypothetical protein